MDEGWVGFSSKLSCVEDENFDNFQNCEESEHRLDKDQDIKLEGREIV